MASSSSSDSTNLTAAALKKRKTGEEVASTEQVDHRKRRRNRTTQSCLNCHGSKRMCDRKRPACSRCVKLGLSGICVYEVDDINQKTSDKDEATHLKSRIAELEGFIREFKRKPHPRWAADLMKTVGDSGPEPGPSSAEATPKAKGPGLVIPAAGIDETPSPTFTATQSSSSSSACSAPPTPISMENDLIILTNPANFPFPAYNTTQTDALDMDPHHPFNSLLTGDKEIDSLFSIGSLPGCDGNDVFDRVFSQILQCDTKTATTSQNSRCQCMQKSSAYSVVLELAPYIKRALDALSALPEHQNSLSFGTCSYLKHLQDLDATTSFLVESVSTSLSPPSSSYVQNNHTPSNSFPPSPTNASPAAIRLWGGNDHRQHPVPIVSNTLDGTSHTLGKEKAAFSMNATSPSSDRFMTWDPRSAPTKWPKTITL